MAVDEYILKYGKIHMVEILWTLYLPHTVWNALKNLEMEMRL